MAKKTEQDTSPAPTGEVNKEGTITPQDTVDTNKQDEENAKKEQEAAKQAELEANERLLNGYEYNGRRYAFTDSMPLKVNLDGQIMSQEEIMSNPDIIESMIDSKNIFIKEI